MNHETEDWFPLEVEREPCGRPRRREGRIREVWEVASGIRDVRLGKIESAVAA